MYFYFYLNIVCDVVTGLLILVDVYHFHYTCTVTLAHIMAHTCKHTCMSSAQEEWRESGTGTRLEGAEVGFVKNKDLAHTHTSN